MECKININLKEGFIQLEGSEDFVSKYLDIYKDFIFKDVTVADEKNDQITDKKNSRDSSFIETAENAAATKANKRGSKPTKAKAITIDKFDLHKDEKNPSLEEFLSKKTPGSSTANIIAVISYYIIHLKGKESFSEGNIDYAYRTLSIPKRPKHLHQIMINAKNKQDFFEQTQEDGKWSLTRTGEIFVDEKLPLKENKK